jgi:hypothetical protein
MKLLSIGMPRVLRLSGVLLILGLAIEAVSLLFNHPLSFMGFIIVGGGLLGIGVLLYLISLVEVAQRESSGVKN